ncbi:MAG: hypothetical protein AAFR33_14300, partial [Pseudomonadota bacterium]
APATSPASSTSQWGQRATTEESQPSSTPAYGDAEDSVSAPYDPTTAAPSQTGGVTGVGGSYAPEASASNPQSEQTQATGQTGWGSPASTRQPDPAPAPFGSPGTPSPAQGGGFGQRSAFGAPPQATEQPADTQGGFGSGATEAPSRFGTTVADTAQNTASAANEAVQAGAEQVSNAAASAADAVETTTSNAASSLKASYQSTQTVMTDTVSDAGTAAKSILGGAARQAAGAAAGAAGAASDAAEGVSQKLNLPDSPSQEGNAEGEDDSGKPKPLTRFNPWS